MKILIDGDACKMINVTEKIAKKYNIPCHIYCNSSSNLKSDYSEVHIVDCSKDAADFAIINSCEKSDIVITNDIGLASMVLTKNAFVINNAGHQFTDDNIMFHLQTRYIRNQTKRKTDRQQIHALTASEPDTAKDYKQILTQLIKIEMDSTND